MVNQAARIREVRTRLNGWYALAVFLPVTELAQRLQRVSRRIRGKSRLTPTTLPKVSWNALGFNRSIRLVESATANGNVKRSELAILAKAAANLKPGTEIIEIGTFDGRTALNLAVNAPQSCRVFTLDLPPDIPTAFALASSERQYVDKPLPGVRFRSHSEFKDFPGVSNIVQLIGDSASFDWSGHVGKAGLVFVDGSHAYEYVHKDTETAFHLAIKGGVIFWHDYGVWEDVTRALEEFESRERRGLVHIRGTSLVCVKVS